MKVLFTRSASHLAPGIDGERVTYVARTFADGEKYVRVESPPAGPLWVVANTQPPADNLLELLFLLDALTRAGAQAGILFPYFAYARQDRVTQPGESLSGAVVAGLVKSFAPVRIIVLHMHGTRMQVFLSYDDLWPFSLVDPLCADADLVVAPDKGAVPFVSQIAARNGRPLVTAMKRRISDEKVEVSLALDDARGKRALIVDDMISTGATMMEVAMRLRAAGAAEVNVYATHGVFSPGARERLEASAIDRIYVTNSLPQEPGGKLVILDVAPLLRQALG